MQLYLNIHKCYIVIDTAPTLGLLCTCSLDAERLGLMLAYSNAILRSDIWDTLKMGPVHEENMHARWHDLSEQKSSVSLHLPMMLFDSVQQAATNNSATWPKQAKPDSVYDQTVLPSFDGQSATMTALTNPSNTLWPKDRFPLLLPIPKAVLQRPFPILPKTRLEIGTFSCSLWSQNVPYPM